MKISISISLFKLTPTSLFLATPHLQLLLGCFHRDISPATQIEHFKIQSHLFSLNSQTSPNFSIFPNGITLSCHPAITSHLLLPLLLVLDIGYIAERVHFCFMSFLFTSSSSRPLVHFITSYLTITVLVTVVSVLSVTPSNLPP